MTLPLGIFSCTRLGPCSEPAALVMQLQSTGYLQSPVIALCLLSPHWFLLVLCNMFTGPEYLDTAQTAPVQTISHLCRPISFLCATQFLPIPRYHDHDGYLVVLASSLSMI